MERDAGLLPCVGHMPARPCRQEPAFRGSCKHMMCTASPERNTTICTQKNGLQSMRALQHVEGCTKLRAAAKSAHPSTQRARAARSAAHGILPSARSCRPAACAAPLATHGNRSRQCSARAGVSGLARRKGQPLGEGRYLIVPRVLFRLPWQQGTSWLCRAAPQHELDCTSALCVIH